MRTKTPAGEPALNQRLSFGIHQLSAQMNRICNPLFRRYKVDQVSCQILVLALERDGIGVGEIINLLLLPQSTISHQVKRLEALGYITRSRSGTDQRVVRVELTATGRLVAEACNALSMDVYRAMVDGISAETSDALRAEMRAMLERLGHVRAANGRR